MFKNLKEQIRNKPLRAVAITGISGIIVGILGYQAIEDLTNGISPTSREKVVQIINYDLAIRDQIRSDDNVSKYYNAVDFNRKKIQVKKSDLKKLLKAAKEINTARYLFVRPGVVFNDNDTLDPEHGLTFGILNNSYQQITSLPEIYSKNCTFCSDSGSYNNLIGIYNILKANGIQGFDTAYNKGGVIFDLEQSYEWLTTKYPNLRFNVKINPFIYDTTYLRNPGNLSDRSITSFIFTNESNLRKRLVEDSFSLFAISPTYGNNGGACCPPP